MTRILAETSTVTSHMLSNKQLLPFLTVGKLAMTFSSCKLSAYVNNVYVDYCAFLTNPRQFDPFLS